MLGGELVRFLERGEFDNHFGRINDARTRPETKRGNFELRILIYERFLRHVLGPSLVLGLKLGSLWPIREMRQLLH